MDGQTDRQTERQNYDSQDHASTALRSKKELGLLWAKTERNKQVFADGK